jgi:glycosyltransferase involved in cell wall biosynthesis
MNKLVTIVIPVYKSLSYLPNALQAVEQQDYPELEVIISDNGMNGSQLTNVIEKHYSKPYKLRQNATTVDVVTHFNQLIEAASGEYFLLLCDDDEISANYVSELVTTLEKYPQAAVALSRQDVIDASGAVTSSSIDNLPSLMSGEDFLKLWCLKKHGFKCFITYLVKTAAVKQAGGYPNFPRGFHASNGDTSTTQDLTNATKLFLHSLESDPINLEFAQRYPEKWRQFQQWLVQLAWSIYLKKLSEVVPGQLSTLDKLKIALSMPHVPNYYVRNLDRLIKDFFPQLHQVYRLARYGDASRKKDPRSVGEIGAE